MWWACIIEIFDVRDINFISPFLYIFILFISIVVDYVWKWVKVLTTSTNDQKVVIKFVEEYIFYGYEIPRALISDVGGHFCHQPFETLLRKYPMSYKMATLYHTQTSYVIKSIIKKTVWRNKKG